VVGSDEAALDAEREAVGPLEPEEVGRDRRELPQNHLTLPPLLFQRASSEGPEGQRSTETPAAAAKVGGGFGGGRSFGSATFAVREGGARKKKNRGEREVRGPPEQACSCLAAGVWDGLLARDASPVMSPASTLFLFFLEPGQ
jgi:hypothetical protein